VRPLVLAVMFVAVALTILLLPGNNVGFAVPVVGGCVIALIMRRPPARPAAVAGAIAWMAAFALLLVYTLAHGLGTEEDNNKWALFAVVAVIFPALCALLAAGPAALVSLVIQRASPSR
jgi:hypothetical protein